MMGLGGLPNYLTLFRIALIPVVVALFYWGTPLAYEIATGIFLMACMTDFLDGYYARLWKQTSELGRFLDPIADKLLVASVLLLLVGFGRIQGLSMIPAIVILCRELLVSGLREFLAEARTLMPVTSLAKWKTAFQMLSLGLLILSPLTSTWIHFVGIIGLWGSAGVTLVTGYEYVRFALRHMKERT